VPGIAQQEWKRKGAHTCWRFAAGEESDEDTDEDLGTWRNCRTRKRARTSVEAEEKPEKWPRTVLVRVFFFLKKIHVTSLNFDENSVFLPKL
jgi:hypothetical protein